MTKDEIDRVEKEYKEKTLQDIVIIRNEFDIVAIETDTKIHIVEKING